MRVLRIIGDENIIIGIWLYIFIREQLCFGAKLHQDKIVLRFKLNLMNA